MYAAILTYVSDSLTPARAQFGFQPGVSVQQALLQAQSNATQNLKHVAVLDLARSYDTVDRQKLLDALA